ncbi:MAG: hypothetical protein WDZ51_09735 [Pirellulaceae bacterium]
MRIFTTQALRYTLALPVTAAVLIATALTAPLAAQQTQWELVDATYLEDRPVTTLKPLSGDRREITLTSSGEAHYSNPQQEETRRYESDESQWRTISETREGDIVRRTYYAPQSDNIPTSNMMPVTHEATRIVYDAPQQVQTVRYEEPVRVAQAPTVVRYQQPTQTYSSTPTYTVQRAEYQQPVGASEWHTIGRTTVGYGSQVQSVSPVQQTLHYQPAPQRQIVTRYQAADVAPSLSVPVVQGSTVRAPVVQAPVVANPAVVPIPQSTFRPVLPLSSMPTSFSLGQGLYGQPKVYPDGQPVRNVLRYLLP